MIVEGFSEYSISALSSSATHIIISCGNNVLKMKFYEIRRFLNHLIVEIYKLNSLRAFLNSTIANEVR